MLCPKCGAKLPEGSAYCSICGLYIENSKTTDINIPNYKQNNNSSPNAFFITLLSVAAALVFIILFSVFTDITPSKEISSSSAASALLSAEESRSPVPSISGTTPPSAANKSNLPVDLDYIDSLISYFNEVALKSEYGSLDEGIVRRWEQPIRIEISGSYTDKDYSTLRKYIDTLKSLQCLPDIQIVQSDGNYAIHFVPLSKMPDLIPGYVEGNWGYITLNWNETCQIENAVMGISTDVTNQSQRNHLILEEFTQGLGLLNDSPKYADSIFQIEWTETQALNAMDYNIVKMLYSPVIKAGMEKKKADYVLKQWLEKNKKSFH